MSKYDLVCITPLDHIPSVIDLQEEVCNLTYLPNIEYNQLFSLLREKKHNAIFTNPNKQNFKIDKHLLSESGIRIINTASTGLNHINLEDCKDLDVKVLSLTTDYDLIRKHTSTSELAFGLAL